MAKRRKLNRPRHIPRQTSDCLSKEQEPIQSTNQTDSEASSAMVIEQPRLATATEIEPDHREGSRIKRKARGATVMANVWGLEQDKKIRVQLDCNGLPVGLEGCILTSFLGTVARNPLYAPINYYDWRKLPLKHKEDMWALVQTKFSFEPTTDEIKGWILNDLNNKWRTWKNILKSKVFDPSYTLEQMLENFNDPRADKGQLKSLIEFWLTDEAGRISKMNKVNREKLREPHAAGTKSFARIVHEDTLLSNGRRPSRAATYIKTRYSNKSGDYVQPESAEIAEAIEAVLEEIDSTQALEDSDAWVNDEEPRIKRKARGATVMANVWGLEPDKKIRVQLDGNGLPIGLEGCILTSFLGTVARNPLYAPINYYDWRKLPSEHKEDMWELVQTKFSFEPSTTDETKRWILTDLNDKWRTWKNILKSKVFDPSCTLEQMLGKFNDPRADKEQLKSLIEFWLTDEAERISNMNKVNREKLKEPHTAGTKSFARITHEDTLLNNGRRPSRAATYIKTRYSTKFGDYVTPEAAEIAEAMKADLEEIDPTQVCEENDTWVNDVYAKHKGPEKPGRAVRCVGKKIVSSSDKKNDGTEEKIAQLENKVTCLLTAFRLLCPDFSMDALQAMIENSQGSSSTPALTKKTANLRIR